MCVCSTFTAPPTIAVIDIHCRNTHTDRYIDIPVEEHSIDGLLEVKRLLSDVIPVL